ncbi:NUDIX domain-containing protein [Streptomyces sp. PSKA30]|uniref:NUDIX hydrolase n=1 Tax=Streptomyces sp. PSKA30 TaxID=2874597 RepID=UPI0027DFC968|nr:NUDIX domain-containing protein [Streptomyces sp. PSKA30]
MTLEQQPLDDTRVEAQHGDGPTTDAPPGSRPRANVKVTADLVVLTVRQAQLKVLLVERGKQPFVGKLALPGGFLREGEDLETTAHRELIEETGLDGADLPLHQLRTYSHPHRDPRGRVITTAFLAIAPNLPSPTASTDARTASWVAVEDTLMDKLAFDHRTILSDALEEARMLLEQTTLATAFCAETFTISELQQVYEIVWGMPVDPRNFRRKVMNVTGFVKDTGLKRPSNGRPATLYQRGPAQILHPAMLRAGNGL